MRSPPLHSLYNRTVVLTLKHMRPCVSSFSSALGKHLEGKVNMALHGTAYSHSATDRT